VPFLAKDVPSPTADFAHVDALISLTYLGFRQEGLQLRHVQVLLRHLKSAMKREPGIYEQRASRVLFQSWIESASMLWRAKFQVLAQALSARSESVAVRAMSLRGPSKIGRAPSSTLGTASAAGNNGDIATAKRTSEEFPAPATRQGSLDLLAAAGLDAQDLEEEDLRQARRGLPRVPQLEFLEVEEDIHVKEAWRLLRFHVPTIEHFLRTVVFNTVTTHREAKISASA